MKSLEKKRACHGIGRIQWMKVLTVLIEIRFVVANLLVNLFNVYTLYQFIVICISRGESRKLLVWSVLHEPGERTNHICCKFLLYLWVIHSTILCTTKKVHFYDNTITETTKSVNYKFIYSIDCQQYVLLFIFIFHISTTYLHLNSHLITSDWPHVSCSKFWSNCAPTSLCEIFTLGIIELLNKKFF